MTSLSTALVSIRRSPFQALASIALISTTFFMAYVFSFMFYGGNKILHYFETNPQIIGFFQINTPTEKIQEVEKIIKEKSYVTEVKIVTQEDALSIYKTENQENPLLLELVTADILPASIEVSSNTVTGLAQLNNDLDAIPEIDDIVFQKDIIELLSTWTGAVRNVGIEIIAIMAINSFLTITAITMLKVSLKKNTVTIMRLIGATKWYIKAPFVIEGMIYGAIGAVIGWILSFIRILYLTPHITNFLGDIPLFPIPVAFYLIQLGVGVIVGVLFGGLAASFAAGRFIRR